MLLDFLSGQGGDFLVTKESCHILAQSEFSGPGCKMRQCNVQTFNTTSESRAGLRALRKVTSCQLKSTWQGKRREGKPSGSFCLCCRRVVENKSLGTLLGIAENVIQT